MKRVYEVFYFGYGILILAAAINWLGNILSLKSWHDLFGALIFLDLTTLNMIWLIVVYPSLLGIGVYILSSYKSKLFK